VKLAAGAALVLALAVAAPASGAGGWRTISRGTLSNIADPGVLRTRAGSELVAYGNGNAGTIELVRNGAAAKVLVSGDVAAGEPRLVQQPDGAIQLYFPGSLRIQRLTSTDDGVTWSGPVDTQAEYISPVESAAVRPDGTPVFSVDNTAGVFVFQGLNGELQRNVFPRCCGYAESLAVDSAGLLQTAFWSNASPPFANYVYEALGADLTPSQPLVYSSGTQTLSNDQRVPLVADRRGNTFAGRLDGYPVPGAFWVDRFRGGKHVGAVRLWTRFSGQTSRMALAVEPNGDLWALWTAQGALHAARSRSGGAHFGAIVQTSLPAGATPYQLEALAADGSVTAYVNTGTALVASPKLLPGLSVKLTRTVRRVGKRTLVSWSARALDDGVGVAAASFSAGGRSVHANGAGVAPLGRLPRHALVSVTAPGYTAASFRSP